MSNNKAPVRIFLDQSDKRVEKLAVVFPYFIPYIEVSFCCVYYSSKIIKIIKSRIKWARHIACTGGNAHEIFLGNFEEKRTLGRPGCRWKDIKVYVE
jgi:hypothetical protein